MSAGHFRLDGLVALIDCNGIQADGPVVLDMEPVADKWRAFGWDTIEIDGNDMAAVVGALAGARSRNGKPKAIVLRTLPGKGVPRIETQREVALLPRRCRPVGRASSPSSSRAWEPTHERRHGSRPHPGDGPGRGGRRRPRRASMRRSARRWRSSAASRREIVGLTADLGKYTDILPFRDAFPDRFFNVGMAEQNLVAVAAGLARTGKVPFATTYGVFATPPRLRLRRHRAARTANLNVKIVAGLPGLTTGYGGTHQAIEDLALMRMIPGLVVIDPCDATEIAAATRGDRRPSTGRSTCACCAARCRWCSSRGYRFEIGKARQLRDGSDVGIISTGFMTERALDAAAALAERRASPPACCTCRRSSRSTPRRWPSSPAAVGQLVTAENHVVVGGLGSLVVETLFDAGIAKKLTRIGLPDRYIECGSVPTLQATYGLTTEARHRDDRRRCAGGRRA